MIADTIQKTNQTLEERGIPNNSYFEIIFPDASRISEHDVNWSSISQKKQCAYFGNKKLCHVCTLPVKRIEAWHDGLHSFIDVPEGCEVYQAVRGDTLIIPNYERTDRVIGRVIGIIKDNEVIEEHFLNGLMYSVEGLRK